MNGLRFKNIYISFLEVLSGKSLSAFVVLWGPHLKRLSLSVERVLNCSAQGVWFLAAIIRLIVYELFRGLTLGPLVWMWLSQLSIHHLFNIPLNNRFGIKDSHWKWWVLRKQMLNLASPKGFVVARWQRNCKWRLHVSHLAGATLTHTDAQTYTQRRSGVAHEMLGVAVTTESLGQHLLYTEQYTMHASLEKLGNIDEIHACFFSFLLLPF